MAEAGRRQHRLGCAGFADQAQPGGVDLEDGLAADACANELQRLAAQHDLRLDFDAGQGHRLRAGKQRDRYGPHQRGGSGQQGRRVSGFCEGACGASPVGAFVASGATGIRGAGCEAAFMPGATGADRAGTSLPWAGSMRVLRC